MTGAVVAELSAGWEEGLSSRRAVVMGMARSGRAAAAALARRGADVVATDVRNEPGISEGLPPEVALELGGHIEETFRGCDLLIVSPGIPATNPFIGAALEGGAGAQGAVAERLARLEEQGAATRAAIERIERRLEAGG